MLDDVNAIAPDSATIDSSGSKRATSNAYAGLCLISNSNFLPHKYFNHISLIHIYSFGNRLLAKDKLLD
jgi:hypothetical protein